MLRPVALVMMTFLAGCATSTPVPDPPAVTAIDASDYSAVFDHAKGVLREANFTIDRVDARRGIITTQAAPSVGLIMPWLGHHRSADEAWQGFIHQEQRRATVLFEAAGGETADLRAWGGRIDVRVRVDVERVEQPIKRHDASGIFFTHSSPKLENDRSIGGTPVAVTRRTDVPFSDFLASEIAKFAENEQFFD